ncbi:MAG TPA: hypothetical protein VFS29_08585 [Motilibacteraceae bacterium]|nr:hypothetical protein [Motilibacteraceae bacterium]
MDDDPPELLELPDPELDALPVLLDVDELDEESVLEVPELLEVLELPLLPGLRESVR